MADNAALWPEEAPWQRVSPRLAWVRRTGLSLLLIPAAIAVAVTAIFTDVAWLPWTIALVALVLVGWGLAVVSRSVRSWGYAERADDLLVRHGILVRKLSVVPYGRMQYVDVKAGPLERALGIATVQLHTAAAASDAAIPGLPTVEAARLRDRLATLGEARAAGL
ncbi:PH domain-containing protein [Cryptosporangium phraense]|uniref:PH domain-containing protein n=1 Tax=Cryptosporangium phraense TaxID=2593070 RepID=A0A545AF06_9ACTN|nr:PH domain-containing protein [Cryptosporangium phraense]TQS39904.1 PH domain-containing protein [Cryptosporangium phraense]